MNKTMEFTKHFYDREAISMGISAYKDLADIRLSEDNNYYFCEIISCRYDIELVLNEFSNYVLGMMNK